MRLTKSGFTIVELLIVIVVIAILAAISIVAYNGIQDRARSSASASSSTQVAKKVKVWQVDNEAVSPTCGQFFTIVTSTTTSSSCSFDYNGTNYQYAAGTNGAYCVTTTVADKSYKVSDTTTPQAGGCPGHGQGGVGAVTNVSVNPSGETNTTGYAGPNGSTVARSTVQSRNGSYSMQATMPAGTTSQLGINITANYVIPTHIAANTTYVMSAYVYVPSATVDVQMSAQGPGTQSSNCGGGASATSVKNSWTRIYCTITTSSSGGIAWYILNSANTTAGMQFYTDSVMITQGTSLQNFADGNTTDWIWNGTVNNSTSTGPPV